MKKLITVLAIATFAFTYAQETPKKACCEGKDKKECKTEDKKSTSATDAKDHKDCKGHRDEKKAKKETAKNAS